MATIDLTEARALVESAYEDRDRVREPRVQQAIEAVVAALDQGKVRVAEKDASGGWMTHALGQGSGAAVLWRSGDGAHRSRPFRVPRQDPAEA